MKKTWLTVHENAIERGEDPTRAMYLADRWEERKMNETGLTPPQRALSADRQALADAMSAISERCCYAGWLSSLEYTLWRFLTYPFDGAWGMALVAESDLEELRALALDLGGWVVWRDFEDGETFLTFEEWQQEHDANLWGDWPKWKPIIEKGEIK